MKCFYDNYANTISMQLITDLHAFMYTCDQSIRSLIARIPKHQLLCNGVSILLVSIPVHGKKTLSHHELQDSGSKHSSHNCSKIFK